MRGHGAAGTAGGALTADSWACLPVYFHSPAFVAHAAEVGVISRWSRQVFARCFACKSWIRAPPVGERPINSLGNNAAVGWIRLICDRAS
jgi:hypothetical protein